MALVWEYDFITLTDGSIVRDNEGKYVVLDARQVEQEDIKSPGGIYLPISKEYYYDIIGLKLVPVIFDYDVIYQLLLEILYDVAGAKLKEKTKKADIDGRVLVLKQLLKGLLGTKTKGTLVKSPIEGKKLSDVFINVSLDSVKLNTYSNELVFNGKKLSPQEIKKKLVGSKINVVELIKSLKGIKHYLNSSNKPITGKKLHQLIQEHIFKGKIDCKALLYLLFDDEGLENANLLDKLTKQQLLILLDEEETD